MVYDYSVGFFIRVVFNPSNFLNILPNTSHEMVGTYGNAYAFMTVSYCLMILQMNIKINVSCLSPLIWLL